MIDRTHPLSLTRQAEVLAISLGSIFCDVIGVGLAHTALFVGYPPATIAYFMLYNLASITAYRDLSNL